MVVAVDYGDPEYPALAGAILRRHERDEAEATSPARCETS